MKGKWRKGDLETEGGKASWRRKGQKCAPQKLASQSWSRIFHRTVLLRRIFAKEGLLQARKKDLCGKQ